MIYSLNSSNKNNFKNNCGALAFATLYKILPLLFYSDTVSQKDLVVNIQGLYIACPSYFSPTLI